MSNNDPRPLSLQGSSNDPQPLSIGSSPDKTIYSELLPSHNTTIYSESLPAHNTTLYSESLSPRTHQVMSQSESLPQRTQQVRSHNVILANRSKTTGIYSYDNGVGHTGPSTFVMPDGTPFSDFVHKKMYETHTYLGRGVYSGSWKLDFSDVSYVLKVSGKNYTRSFTESEAEILSNLSRGEVSSYVNKLIAAQIEPTAAYILIEYIPGVTMEEWLRTHPDNDELAAVQGELETGLELIHAAGYIHFDIKPDNIWIPTDRSRHALYIDFGLSKPIGYEYKLKSGRTMKATREYNKKRLNNIRNMYGGRRRRTRRTRRRS